MKGSGPNIIGPSHATMLHALRSAVASRCKQTFAAGRPRRCPTEMPDHTPQDKEELIQLQWRMPVFMRTSESVLDAHLVTTATVLCKVKWTEYSAPCSKNQTAGTEHARDLGAKDNKRLGIC